MEIKVTVLMPVYQTEKYIAEAISSVLSQTFTDFELLIVNDGSTDRSVEIARSFNDPRILIVDEPHRGVAAALNRGLDLARGEFIARFDSDDICYPTRLQEQYDFMISNPDYVLIGSDANYIDQHGETLYYHDNLSYSCEDIRKTIHSRCPFIHSTVFYRTKIARELAGYDLRAHTFEDYYFWTRFINKGKVKNFNKPLISVRINPQSLTVDEKLRGKRFISLKKEILFQPGEITQQQEEKLVKILSSQDLTSFKQYSYHILVAKKYLWNNYQPRKARFNLRKAISYRPFSRVIAGLFLVSLLPKKFLEKLYKTYKKIN